MNSGPPGSRIHALMQQDLPSRVARDLPSKQTHLSGHQSPYHYRPDVLLFVVVVVVFRLTWALVSSPDSAWGSLDFLGLGMSWALGSQSIPGDSEMHGGLGQDPEVKLYLFCQVVLSLGWAGGGFLHLPVSSSVQFSSVIYLLEKNHFL